MELKSKLKIIFFILFFIGCVILTLKVGIDIRYNKEIQNIYENRNTMFDIYDKNSALVTDFLKVYEIVDENSYQQIKNELFDKLSVNMQKEYFSSVNYNGLELHNMDVKINRIIGTNNGIDNKNIFIVDYNLKGVNYNKNITNIFEIENGVITSVERIGR